MNHIAQKIQSILFYKGEPVNLKDLCQILKIQEEEALMAISEIKTHLNDSGLVLSESEKEFCLVTSPNCSEIIQQMKKEELDRNLSKSALETLAIILYRGPLKRSDIDFIRGVNSQFILRNLHTRGLIEKETDLQDERSYQYRASIQLLNYLGVQKAQNLPEYAELNKDIEAFWQDFRNENISNNTKNPTDLEQQSSN